MVKESIKKETPVKEASNKPIISEAKSKVKVVTPLKDLVQALIEVRELISGVDKQYKEQVTPLKAAKKDIELEILKNLKETEQYSARFKGATATLSVRKGVKVIDEDKAVADLKIRGLKDYYSTRLSPLFHDSLAKEVKKGNIEVDGVEVTETEYISVRTSKKKDPRKLNVEPFKAIERN